MALQANHKNREVNLSETPFLTDSRTIAEIAKHQITDAYWLGADIELDKHLLAIEVPTTRGLIGYRKFILQKESIAQFNTVKSLLSLKKLTACQGQLWPDTKILMTAGMRVTTALNYEDLFKMLAAIRCDYFPRRLHDHSKEVGLRKSEYQHCTSYDHIMLYYPFAVFFYVAQNNELLAKELEAGMRKLAKEGKIEELMKQHVLTQHIFPLDNSSYTRLFKLDNPFMNTDVDTSNAALWLQPWDFGIETKPTTQNNP